MAGVTTPSPITMPAPSKTTSSKAVRRYLCFSRYLFNAEDVEDCAGGPYLYAESSSSAAC